MFFQLAGVYILSQSEIQIDFSFSGVQVDIESPCRLLCANPANLFIPCELNDCGATVCSGTWESEDPSILWQGVNNGCTDAFGNRFSQNTIILEQLYEEEPGCKWVIRRLKVRRDCGLIV